MKAEDFAVRDIRTLLFLPASNPRAVAKALTLACDMVILDLEDAVPDADKADARSAAVAALAEGFGNRLTAVRINGFMTPWHDDDLTAVNASRADFIVIPKVESAAMVAAMGKPVVTMIESPSGIANARDIAAAQGVAALLAGTNDLKAELGIPFAADRAGLMLALQSIVLAARLAGIAAFDGVFNALDDDDRLARECSEGRALGFDGKSLIHPGQIATANRLFGPSEAEIDDARALIAAATAGAERFRGRMVEAMHVAAARRLLARAPACTGEKPG